MSYYVLPGHFLVPVGKINMLFFSGTLRMELKCYCYDVTNVDICYVFYCAKMTEAYFKKLKTVHHNLIVILVLVLDRACNVIYLASDLHTSYVADRYTNQQLRM